MAETQTFKVETVYSLSGNITGKLNEIDSASRRAAASSESLGQMLKGIGTAVIGGIGFREATKHLISFNANVEDTKNQIAGMIALASKTSFTSQLANADKIFANLQHRAASLPGTTQEYVTMAGMLAQPIIDAGLGMKGLEDMTVNTVVAARSLGLEAQASARDVDQALRGQFHANDQFTGRLLQSMGYKGEAGRAKFNALDAAKRAAELQKAIMQPQIGEMAEAQGKSFSGMMSTLEDAMQQTLGKVGLPLFKEISKEAQSWIKYLDTHSGEIERWAKSVGQTLVTGFGYVKTAIGFMVDHASTLIKVAEAWAFMKVGSKIGGLVGGMLASVSGGPLAQNIGGKGGLGMAALGPAMGALGLGLGIGELLNQAGAAHEAAEALGLWTGKIDKTTVMNDRLVETMKRFDEAVEDSTANLANLGGAAASSQYSQTSTLAGQYRELAHQLQGIANSSLPGGAAMAATMKNALLDRSMLGEKTAGMLAGMNQFTAAGFLSGKAEVMQNRADAAAVATNWLIAANMATLNETQKQSVDVQKASKEIFEKAFRGQEVGLDIRKLLLSTIDPNNTLGAPNTGAQAKMNQTVNISINQVTAKDPGRWLADLDDYAAQRVRARTRPRSALARGH